jgi:GT2 family glycosyltransferase
MVLTKFIRRWEKVKKVDLSIIILSYNTKELLKRCLQSLQKAKKNDYQIEVIVVDNASSDKSPEMVEKEFSQVKLIRSKKNLGYAGGNNLGLKKAQGEFILFLNSDTEIDEKALIKMMKFMKENPRAGASTPKTMLFSGGMDPDCHRGFPTPWASITYFLGLEKLFPKSKLFGQYHQFYLNLNKSHEIDAGFGTFMFVRKKVLEAVGEWDDQYFFYGEDLDLFYRIKEAGWKIMFYSEPLATHHKGASSGLRKESKGVTRPSRQTRIRVAKASIEAMEIFYKKFYQDKYPFWLTWVVLLGIRIKGGYRIVLHYFKR